MNNVKYYRKKLGLTQKDLAETFKISTPAFCAKERGRVDYNSREMMTFKRMVQKIKPDVTIDEIFFNEIPKQAPIDDVIINSLELVLKGYKKQKEAKQNGN